MLCFYRKRFQPIGGTNCRRAGIYVMERNCNVELDMARISTRLPYEFTSTEQLYVLGRRLEIDHKQKLLVYRFFELALRF